MYLGYYSVNFSVHGIFEVWIDVMFPIRSWSEIAKSYRDLDCDWCNVMADLADRLAEFPGLNGVKSMHDLYISQARNVFDNPRLKIGPYPAYFHGPIICRVSYESGPWASICKEWHIDVEWADLKSRVERLLFKRLRWYKE